MRKELELIALIERYLRGEMNDTQRAEFEQRLQADTTLQEEVRLQQDLMAVMQRMGLRAEVKKAYRKYRINRDGWKWGLGTVAVVAIAFSAWYYTQNTERRTAYELPQLNEAGKPEWSDADKYLPYQYFTINMANDTVIESAGGVVIAIPAGAFIDASGHAVNGNVQFEYKEALDAASIMTSGLNTKSNGQPLETGGMFYINARDENGNSLSVSPGKKLYTEVPSGKDDKDMQLFDGERTADGGINWVNPKPQETYLTPVDIFSLDFYPPGYIDSLASWGYDVSNKAWTDSVFYSFYCDSHDYMTVQDTPSADTSINAVATDSSASGSFYHLPGYCRGIEPSDIHAIWNERFQNTLFATKEFEERLPHFYNACENGFIDFFVKNIDKPLYYFDSLIASAGERFPISTQFKEFAKQRKGKVDVSNKLVKALGEYYTMKRKAYQQAVGATYEKLKAEREEISRTADKLSYEETKRQQDDFEKEYKINLTEAYRQLGYSFPEETLPGPGPRSTVNFAVTSTGWKNVDQYVYEATANRETMDYTDPNGKTATITYKPIAVRVDNAAQFEQLYVYLLTPELNSFLRMEKKDDTYTEKFNTLFEYHVAAVGYIDGQLYFAKTKTDASSQITLVPDKLSQKALATQLNHMYPGAEKAINKELNYQNFLIKYQRRQQQDAKEAVFRNKLTPIVYSCSPNAERGAQLYKANCTSCHKHDGILIGPSLAGVVQRWDTQANFQYMSGKYWLHEFIRDWETPVKEGNPYALEIQNFSPSTMTKFPELSDSDIESIILYLSTTPATKTQ